MRRIFAFILGVVLSGGIAFAAPESRSYTVIETINDYTPVRESASDMSKRFSHLKKGTTVFSDSVINNFYRIDLGLGQYYWIEKKYVKEKEENAKKEPPKISEIEFMPDSKYYTIKIKTPVLTAYNEIETSNKSLDFILYDCVLDEENLKLEGENPDNFKISKDEFNNLKISYNSTSPLTGHEVIKVEDGLLLKVKKPFKYNKEAPLRNFVFVIDPGHGGSESGAVAFDLKEKDINLQISKMLKERLRKEGAVVYLTRNDDSEVDLYDRIDFAKERKADFLLSIHQNSLQNPKNVDKKHGVGVYYYNKEAYNLAKEIQAELVKGTEFQDDGVNFASFALTRSTNPLCVLIECGYIIHPEEAKMLQKNRFQRKIAFHITKGVKNWLKSDF